MDVTVVVATYGDSEWVDLAHERAIPSVRKLGVPYVHLHGSTLQFARNDALAQVTTPWMCYLDADDELEAGYFRRMEQSTAEIRVPSVRYVRNRFDQGVRMPKVAGHSHDCSAECLPFGNWIVIGAVVRTSRLRDVGGFRDFPWSEDWDLWVRCWKAGATIQPVPRAVYRAHVRRNSRNRAASNSEKVAAHNLIAEANGLPLVAA